ncbi:DeoR/GlpR family DNA-binding transcription regulator [Roseateles sp. SL47]|jgi:DeoR family transcriptional regulator, fructose operon transcriptional repressor|uniref:DeoR/GlpR family DNA-binding transcription regulator n=1 Tax=Roseateles sp. SL47 TaxID=2995138 RepID=UPI002270724C|nr:DeoR/GlpR family DNA-binding transcription regulator [Roseateles sp. SL47]WAC73580.1 DeoR/GlpR family DNA-binding transcription regulator [Roseateles sp. SL47]
MWSQERHDRILSMLHERHRVTTETAARELGVSKETVRRDLIELEQNGKLSRVHGGAVPTAVAVEASYAERAQSRQRQKQAMGRVAAGLLRPGSTCLIDAGSTTRALAQVLAQQPGLHGLRLITNSVAVADALAGQGSHEVMLLGGDYHPDVQASFGAFTIAEIARHRVDLAFISPTALDAAMGASSYVWAEVALAQAMLGQARQRVLLADASKLGQGSRMQVCRCSDIDVLITDADADPQELARLRQAGIGEVLF